MTSMPLIGFRREILNITKVLENIVQNHEINKLNYFSAILLVVMTRESCLIIRDFNPIMVHSW